MLSSVTIDEFMKVYDELVPHVYVPEPLLMKDILEMLEVVEREKALQLMPRFLSQIVMFDMLDRHQIIKFIFRLMSEHCSPPEKSPLHEQYAKMACTLWTHMQVR